MARRIEFQKFVQEFRKQKINLPKIIGNIALRHFRQSFRDEGFTDKSLVKWQPRKRPNAADMRTKRRRGLLVDSDNLRLSLRVKSANFRSIRVGSYGIPYAQIHNRGGAAKAFGKHAFTMPQRQFIGRSAKLRSNIENRISKSITQIFK